MVTVIPIVIVVVIVVALVIVMVTVIVIVIVIGIIVLLWICSQAKQHRILQQKRETIYTAISH